MEFLKAIREFPMTQFVLSVLFVASVVTNTSTSYFVFFACLGFSFYNLIDEKELHITNNIVAHFHLKHNAKDLEIEEEKQGEIENG